MSIPFFSLIVPTRNRAMLLQQTLPALLAVDFPDCEILISDNCSTPETRAAVEPFLARDSRLRYVRAERPLSMVDSYEFGLNAARGEYLVFGSDDDAFTSGSLRQAAEVIRRHNSKELLFASAAYWHPDVPDEADRGRLSCHRGTGQVYEIPAEVAIAGWNQWEFPKYTNLFPKILKCVTHRSVIEAARKVTGQFFVPPYPDSSGVCQVLANVKCYHFLDLPLYVGGISAHSNSGIQYDRKRKFEAYFELFDHDLLEGCPYPMRYTNAAHWQATQILFRKHYPAAFHGELSLGKYLELAFRELTYYGDYDDVTEEMAQLRGYLHEFHGSAAAFDALKASAAANVRKTGNEPCGPLYAAARAIYRKLKAMRRRSYRADGRAANIAEAAKIVGKATAGRFASAPTEAVRIHSIAEMAALAQRAAFG